MPSEYGEYGEYGEYSEGYACNEAAVGVVKRCSRYCSNVSMVHGQRYLIKYENPK